MAASKNATGVTRDELKDHIAGLRDLVDVRFTSVLDKIDNTHMMIKNHIDQEEVTTRQIRADVLSEKIANKEAHGLIHKDVEGLKKYKWTLVGAICLGGVVLEIALRLILPIIR